MPEKDDTILRTWVQELQNKAFNVIGGEIKRKLIHYNDWLLFSHTAFWFQPTIHCLACRDHSEIFDEGKAGINQTKFWSFTTQRSHYVINVNIEMRLSFSTMSNGVRKRYSKFSLTTFFTCFIFVFMIESNISILLQ